MPVKHPARLHIYPAPGLLARPDRPFIPGVGIDGAELPYDIAVQFVERGDAVLERPDPPPGDTQEQPAGPSGQDGPSDSEA